MPDIFNQPGKNKQQEDPATEQAVIKPVQEEQPQSQPETQPQDQAVVNQSAQTQEQEKPPSPHFSSIQNAEKHMTEILDRPEKTVGLFTHYCENPSGIRFINQEDNETILLFLRRHFITNVPWLLIFFLLLLFPPIVFALFKISNFTLFSIPTTLVLILLAFYYLIIANYALLNFIDWFYDIGIITRKRVIDLDAENILQHHLAETEVEDLVDVSYQQRGFFQSFFNYGDIHIQTEAIKANFEYIAAPKPSDVSDIISDLKVATKGST